MTVNKRYDYTVVNHYMVHWICSMKNKWIESSQLRLPRIQLNVYHTADVFVDIITWKNFQSIVKNWKDRQKLVKHKV